jgi:predicted transposase YdaD
MPGIQMDAIHNPHDKFFRAAMCEREVALAYFKTRLPTAILRRTNMNTLMARPETFVDAQLTAFMSDALFSVEFQNQPGYFYLLAEHFSTPLQGVPFILLAR